MMPEKHRRAASAPDCRIPDDREAPNQAWMQERIPLLTKLRYVYRNDEYFQGAVDQFLDAEIGDSYRCEPDVDGDALGIQPEQKHKLDKKILDRWMLYSESKRHWSDAGRKKSATGVIRNHARSGRLLGEAITVIRFLDREKTNRPWGTCAQLIDPLRIDTPPEFQNDPDVISGFRVNEHGEELGFYYANKYPIHSGLCQIISGNGNILNAGIKYEWIPKENEFGREMYVHSFVEDEPDLVRGVPPSASALQTMIDLKDLDHTVNKRARWTAKIAAVIESDYPDAEDVLIKDKKGKVQKVPIGNYIHAQACSWAGDDGYMFDDLEGKKMFPGERVKFNNPIDEATNHSEHERSRLRRVGRSQGMSTEQIMQDWSKTNFSGQRAGSIAFNQRVRCDRGVYPDPIANAMLCGFIEEDIAQGNIDLREFGIEGVGETPTDQWMWFVSGHNRDYLTKSRWYGPVREEIDEEKKLKKYKLLQDMGYLPEQLLANEVLRMNWMDLRRQLKREELFKEKCDREAEEQAETNETASE